MAKLSSAMWLLVFFGLLVTAQYFILRQAFTAQKLRQQPVEYRPLATPKSSRLPTTILIP